MAFTLRFERGPESIGFLPFLCHCCVEQRIHTLLNIYQINSGSTNVYEGLLRWGTIFDTAKDGGSLKFVFLFIPAIHINLQISYRNRFHHDFVLDQFHDLFRTRQSTCFRNQFRYCSPSSPDGDATQLFYADSHEPCCWRCHWNTRKSAPQHGRYPNASSSPSHVNRPPNDSTCRNHDSCDGAKSSSTCSSSHRSEPPKRCNGCCGAGVSCLEGTTARTATPTRLTHDATWYGTCRTTRDDQHASDAASDHGGPVFE